jgi:hypothetical protein
MDLKLHRPQGVCAKSGRPFAAGELFYSTLVRTGGRLDRLDIDAEAWDGPPPGAIAWWRSQYPAATETAPTLAPIDVLLDALESLGEPGDEPLRYLLALQLVRRRVLRIVDDPAAAPGTDELRVACRRRDREYRIRSVGPPAAGADEVEQRLAALLWSGGAA